MKKLSLLLFNKKFNFNQILLGSEVLNQNDSKAIHTVTHLSGGEFNMFDGQLNELQVAIVIRVSCFLAEFRLIPYGTLSVDSTEYIPLSTSTQ